VCSFPENAWSISKKKKFASISPDFIIYSVWLWRYMQLDDNLNYCDITFSIDTLSLNLLNSWHKNAIAQANRSSFNLSCKDITTSGY
jgi:hypothetical protein